MPVATVSPRDFRALAPAPLARRRGRTPRIKVNEVMICHTTDFERLHPVFTSDAAEIRPKPRAY